MKTLTSAVGIFALTFYLSPAWSGEEAEIAGTQVMKELPIRVVEEDGSPITGVKIQPWALRSSQGHGHWRNDEYDRTEVSPQSTVSAEDGTATVMYPYFRDVGECIKSTSVSIHVDHPEFASPDAIDIDVPREQDQPYQVVLSRGISFKLRPTIDGKPVGTENLFVLSSDERIWKGGDGVKPLEGGLIQIPPISLGPYSFLVVRLDGNRATHFSALTDLEVTPSIKSVIDVPLFQSQTIAGKVSDHVPRPIKQGRAVFLNLPPAGASGDRVSWVTWRPIREDGTFTLDGWPADEPIQVIALADHLIGKSGEAPEEVENVRDPDPSYRSQTFRPGEPIEIDMVPRIEWAVTAVDEDDQPIAGVQIDSWPNIHWWNWGSQLYGELYRSETFARDQQFVEDQPYPPPFRAITSAKGEAFLSLPARDEILTVTSDVYELPVFLGRRIVKIEPDPKQGSHQVTLRLQPIGSERLGEWDKLAGVVFGCSTREGRRICALPEVSAKFDEFANQFREAKNQQDPKLLAEAYSLVADAFAKAGDAEESLKWIKKAAEQAAKFNQHSKE